MATETKAPTAVEAVVDHIDGVATIAGMIDAASAGVPKAAWEIEGMSLGMDLGGIVEGGIPDVVHVLEDQLEALGEARDAHSYWRQYCRGYQVVVLLRERAEPKAFRHDPEEWMKQRMEAAVDA